MKTTYVNKSFKLTSKKRKPKVEMVIFVGEGERIFVLWRCKRPSTLISCSGAKLSLGKFEGTEAKKSNSIQANVLIKPAIGESYQAVHAICEGGSLCFGYVREIFTYNLFYCLKCKQHNRLVLICSCCSKNLNTCQSCLSILAEEWQAILQYLHSC
jgi:hypothetical protein